MKLYEIKPEWCYGDGSVEKRAEQVEALLKVKVVFNSSTRLWACGNMTGKKPIELARKALHGASVK